MSKQLSRRTVLQGIGASLALPYLEAMNGWTAYGAPAVGATPKRLAYFYVPNGVHMQDWSPEEVGPGYKMPFLLESTLSKFREVAFHHCRHFEKNNLENFFRVILSTILFFAKADSSNF